MSQIEEKEPDFRIENTVYEITVGVGPNPQRYATGNRIRLPNFGECTIDSIELDTYSYHNNGFGRWWIILRLESGEKVVWRSIPCEMCLVTYNLNSQV
jgi:hypothetical protein